MTSKKSTKRALLMSALSLLLCVSMLVGTTFAWFTDEVKSGTNIIAAGNLDVELTHTNKAVTNEDVTGATNLFKDVKLWEPGAVAYEKLTVKNVGDLALKYNLAINVAAMNGVEVEGKYYTLADALKVAVVAPEALTSREAAIAAGAGKWQTLGSWAENGELYPETGKDTETYGVVIYWEPTDNDNLFNMNNGKKTTDGGKQLTIDLGVHLTATQLMHEEDSFGKDYDALANEWDGSVGEVPAADANNVITLTTGAELAAFAASVNSGNSYSGKTVKLGADINLGNELWTSIGDCESGAYFQGIFDGQGHTIYNLYVDYSTDESKHATAGLFGWVDAAMATVKNVNIDGATVKGSHWVGVIAGYFTGRIENCSVNNATVSAFNLNDEANGDKVGGIVGCLNEHSYLNNNTVTNSTISGNRDIGGIAGSVAASTYEMKNNKVTNVTINFATSKDYGSAGEIVSGRTGYTPNETNVATNVTISNNKLVADGVFETAANTYSIVSKEGLMNISGLLPDWNPENRWTVNLMTDIDMSGETWIPMSDMFVDFNGNGHTISNLTVNGDSDWAGRSGFFAYLGGSTISNLTLKNVTSTGSQAGIFAGHSEAGNLINCTIAGTNTVTWNKATSDKVGDGIGAFVGVNIESSSTYTCTIAEGATVTLNMGKMSSEGKAIAKTNIYAGGLYQDSAPTVTVTNNGTVKASKAVSNAAELTAAVDAGVTDIYLLDGEYNLSGLNGKTVTLTGTEKAVIKVVDDGEKGLDAGCDGATITFNGVTFDTTANGGQYKGFTRMSGTYNDCAFVGSYTTSSGVHKFYNCTFDLKNNYVWTWGASEVLFDNCTFEDANGVGKAILVHEGAAVTNVTVRDCTFTASTAAYTWDGLYVAAVSIDPNGASKKITVNFEGTNTVVIAEGATVDANGNTGFAGLYQIKYANESSQITVKINGEVVDNIVATDYNPNLNP